MIPKNNIIKQIIEISYLKKEGHIASSLSILDILYVLYLKIKDNNHDKFILSKGHASLGLYSVLNYFNLLEDNIYTFCDFNSNLGGHPTVNIKNVEASTGSLGHGFPIAIGLALSKKIKKESGNVYVLIGDGESDEGTIWESALLAKQYNLDNLYCIMDHNHSNDRAIVMNNVNGVFDSLGWSTQIINGHDHEQIKNAIEMEINKPKFILCETIKGKGCKRMENNPEWHHKFPSKEEYLEIMKELECENNL